MAFLVEQDPPPRIGPPDPDRFEREYVRTSRPVVITGIVDRWRASQLWTPEYLKATYGAQAAPTAKTPGGMTEHSPRGGIPLGTMDVAAAIDAMSRGGGEGGYVMAALDRYLKPLADDVETPVYCPKSGWQHRRLWLSAKNTATPLHRDFPENLFAQVRGRKQMVLCPPDDTHLLYSFPIGSRLPNFSAADVETPDYARFPRLRRARRRVVVLAPGELLYLPSRWWHQARSVDDSISINFWWAVGPYRWMVAATSAWKRLRGRS